MSQIASAYGLSSGELSLCARLFQGREYAAFWERLRRHEIAPAFGHSGYVIVVAREFLRERGIQLPVNPAAPGLDALAPEGGVVACASPTEGAATCRALAGLAASSAELAACWEGWFGTRDAGAEGFLRAGLGWLQEVLRAGAGHEWTLVWVG